MISRRQLLRGRLSAQPLPLRPPWALAEADFTASCSRCGDCVRACPGKIIRQGDGGFPEIDFRYGECSFCGDCVTACPTPALQRRESGAPPWRAVAAILDSCIARRGVTCQVCQEQCEARAIRFSPRAGRVPVPELDAGLCSGCGACVASCPVSAIAVSLDRDQGVAA